MNKRIFVLTCMLFGLAAGAARAEQFFDGCTDPRGQAVVMEEDFAQPELAKPAAAGQGIVLRHNPLQLAQAPEALRLYIYARACAPIALGQGAGTLAPKAAREADCWAARTLTGAGSGVSPDLLDQQWNQLSPAQRGEAGPVPQAALATCGAAPGTLRLPAAEKAPTPAWNACVQGCAARLLQCGRGGSCQQGFEQCRARCDGR